MARPKKETVDYFPHFVKGGRTIFILENKFGNDGYAFWFKVLEILGESEGHFYDCSNASNWEFFLAKTRVTEDTAKDIIKVLINLGKIDAELWNEHRVLWIENFVRNLSEVYRTRHTDLPKKPYFKDKKQPEQTVFPEKTQPEDTFSTGKTTKGKESKEKESIVKESKEKYPYQDICALWNSICKSLPKISKLSDLRRAKIKARLNEFGKPESWMPTCEALFEEVESSNFLRGENKSNWQATFDWLFNNGTNWVKVMEGNYANKGQQRKAGSATLGCDERIENGRRTYGSGKVTIPMNAPPRPGDKYAWDSSTQKWVLL